MPRAGGSVGTLLPVALAVVFALAASGRTDGVSLALGAVAAFFGETGWLVAPAVGALLLSIAFAERSPRVRDVRARAVHIGLAAVAGACGATLVSAYVGAPLTLRSVSVVLAAVLAVTPFLIEADDPRSVLLESAAGTPRRADVGALFAPGPSSCGAPTRSCSTARRPQTCASRGGPLEKLVVARMRLQSGASPKSETAALVVSMVDKQIVDHIASLTRAHTAATTRGAAEIGLDDTALRGVHARGEALEEQSRAIVEVKAG